MPAKTTVFGRAPRARSKSLVRASFVERLEQRDLLSSQPYSYSNVTIKGNGFIDGIVYGPAGSGKVYAHTDMGGAYRWDTSANKWQPMTDWITYNDPQAHDLGVETIAVDPNNGSRVYMALGTYMSQTAIMRSSDGGVTWSRSNVSFNSNGNGNARNAGERMVVDPNAPNILYYGTRDDGMWKSTDGGANWAQVTAFPTIGEDTGYLADTGILWVIIDKSSSPGGTASKVIYAGVADSTAGTARIYRSTDAGANWSAVPGGQYTAANTFPERAALTPDGSELYLTYSYSTTWAGPSGLSAGKFFRVDNPDSATPVWNDRTPVGTKGLSGIDIDPTNPRTVYLTEIDNYNPSDRLWKSTDAGANWTSTYSNDNKDVSSAPWAASMGMHWEGDIQIDPGNANIAMLTSGYGVFRTTNLTAATPLWTFFNEGLEQSAVSELNVPHTGTTPLLSAILDRDGFRHTSLTAVPTTRLGQSNGITMGSNSDIDSAYYNASYVVRTGNGGNYAQYSNDNGVNWAYFGTPPTGATGAGNIAISAEGAHAVWSPTGTAKVFYSVRTGTTWSAWTTPTSNQPADNALIVSDMSVTNTFFAYQGSTIWQSTDGGINWSIRTTAAPTGGIRLRAVPGQTGDLVMSRGGSGLWRSTDSGATWSQLGASSITTANHVAVGAGPTSTSYPSLYIDGTVNGTTGFFRSDDQGANWITISDANHQYGAVKTLQADSRIYGKFYIGTNGRGIIVGTINGSITGAATTTTTAKTAAATPTSTTTKTATASPTFKSPLWLQSSSSSLFSKKSVLN